MQPLTPNTPTSLLSVSELNQITHTLISETLGALWVEGEISNLAKPRSGHIYFTLKDAGAQVRCSLFRQQQRGLIEPPADGQKVEVLATPSLYAARGDFQLIIKRLQPAGLGALMQAFAALKKKLSAEGLFDEQHKKTIPPYPSRIGVITSSTGAALQDILTVLKRRNPSITVRIYPSLVQGEQAADDLCNAIKLANQEQSVDLLLLARGGGSLEDLWPFNEEQVARAIACSQLPIITGIGHETDTTIADWVADQRGATPSAAAELACPERDIWLEALMRHYQQLQRSMERQIEQRRLQLAQSQLKLQQLHPKAQLATHQSQLKQVQQHLRHTMTQYLTQLEHKFITQTKTLEALSPLKTLARGFSIVSDDTGRTVYDATCVQPQDKLDIVLHRGRIAVEVLRRATANHEG